jgi:hypothetical protein
MLLREQDLKQIEQTLYTPVESELVARRILRVNTNYNKFATSIGYHWYSKKGSAKILAAGAGAKDIPFVSEDGGEEIRKVYDIVTGIRFSLKEIEASQMRSAQTNVPSVRLDMLRSETARRFIAETENRIALVGDLTYKISGLINHVGINIEDVGQGAFSGTAAQKRLWKNKTPKEKFLDLMKARTVARQKGKFVPDTCVLPPDQFDMLDEPFSDSGNMTVRSWMNSQGLNIPKIFSAQELGLDYNGYGVDCFLMLDSRPFVAELAVTRELELFNPVYDILGNSEQAVMESLAGVILRHPEAVYVGKGI